MPEAPTTRPSLLFRLRDPADQRAWAEFVGLYAPFVYGFLRKQGLQDADAADLTQVVLRAVVASMSSFDYDPMRGSFRGWLFTIVRNKLRNYRAESARRWQGTGDTAMIELLQSQPAPEAEVAAWQREWEQRLFQWLANKVKPDFQESTWQAFWRTAIDGERGKDVAESLGMSVAAVYLAKSRVMARLRDEIQAFQDE